eukprot:XP_011670896.1 PREDICTED: uncharacterized protein LOC105441474 [Strongylocentrotus purpuratus]
MPTDDMTSLRLKRRGTKAKFTRLGNVLDFLIEEKRPVEEVKEAFKQANQAYVDLQSKHEAYTEKIENDEEFNKEELWLDECQNYFCKLQIREKDYISQMSSSQEPQQPTERDEESSQRTFVQAASNRPQAPRFNMERPKLPTFQGDIREYNVFKADFQHVIHPHYDERDALMILRSCLKGKPLQHIRGIGRDYEAAWGQLDLLYEDSRMVADAIMEDVSRFRPLKDGEDERFCDFVNLIRRSFNTLKEVDRAEDMNNSHMLAIIEKKLYVTDGQMWFRKQGEGTTATLEALLKWMEIELRARIRSSAPVRNDAASKSRSAVSQVTAFEERQQDYRCWICKNKDGHWIDQCKTFLDKSTAERLEMVKSNRACYSCLKQAGREHRMATCKKRRRCPEKYKGQPCKFFHHPLLHPSMDNNAVGVALVRGTEAMLPVIRARFSGSELKIQGNVLLDSGAQISIIRQGLAEDLGLTGKSISITITKVGCVEESVTTSLYRVPVSSVGGKTIHKILAVGLPCINDDIEEVNIDNLARQVGLNPRELRRGSGSIDLLIGIDHAMMHAGETRQRGNFIFRKSPLGWVVFGASKLNQQYQNRVLNVQLSPATDLSAFWTTESMGVDVGCHCEAEMMTKVEKEEHDLIWNSAKKVGKQWLVPYPWKDNPEKLPDNRVQAERMLQATEKRLAKNPEHAEVYKQQMQEMVEMGFSRKLTDEEKKRHDGPVHYIGHHAVVRPEKKSTPVRIVFNSSAVFKGQCLNDYWFKGPDLLQSLFGVLLRFREHRVAICADISKMYHRVLIPESDQHVHRYLWRGLDSEREPDVYVKTVVTFGDKPAAAMAQIALRRTAVEGESQHPKAAEVLKRDTYMDDICTSVRTSEEAKDLVKDIDEVLADGGFKVKGWQSNEQLKDETSQMKTNVLENLSEEKVLGMVWNQNIDEFSYRVKRSMIPDLPDEQKDTTSKWTKRRILSQIAKIFDPIGFASALLVKAKIGMQRLWQLGLDWDEELPSREKAEWVKLFREMENLDGVSFQRCLTPPGAMRRPTLCVFCDASEEAFGACVYIRWELEDGSYDVRFVTAKSRVAPLKKLTLPRLELQAAVVAVRLDATIRDETTLELRETVFMTDSMIVLGWVRSQARSFKPFVSARVGEIQSKSNPQQWRHVSGAENPADDISRGVTVEKLERCRCGPQFLRSPEEEWPQSETKSEISSMDSERRKVQQVSNVVLASDSIDCERVSSWRKLVRVTAYVRRFTHNMKARVRSGDERGKVTAGPLTAAELGDAEMYWVREAQKPLHDRLKKGEFKTLTPYIENGIIRVGGRVGEGVISYDSRHPVLLPHQHRISTLITKHVHELGHDGVATTAAKVRSNYWVIGIHRLAKTIKHRCVMCRKMQHKVESQFMAELPEIRMTPFSPPFLYTSCDYFGPYSVKVGRNKVAKHYGVIFTCLNTRAVHLDLAVDVSTMEFLQVLRRFFAFRGQPKVILSDNGTQFVGAVRELREMVKGWDSDLLREFCAEKGVEWRFTTPSAPHQNGCAEALVKSS